MKPPIASSPPMTKWDSQYVQRKAGLGCRKHQLSTGGSMAYIVDGTGPIPVLAIHGLHGAKEQVRSVLPSQPLLTFAAVDPFKACGRHPHRRRSPRLRRFLGRPSVLRLRRGGGGICRSAHSSPALRPRRSSSSASPTPCHGRRRICQSRLLLWPRRRGGQRSGASGCSTKSPHTTPGSRPPSLRSNTNCRAQTPTSTTEEWPTCSGRTLCSADGADLTSRP